MVSIWYLKLHPCQNKKLPICSYVQPPLACSIADRRLELYCFVIKCISNASLDFSVRSYFPSLVAQIKETPSNIYINDLFKLNIHFRKINILKQYYFEPFFKIISEFDLFAWFCRILWDYSLTETYVRSIKKC